MADELIGESFFVERYEVKAGQFKGKLYWGQHLDIDNTFEPHGFGILVDEESMVIQLGNFKHGKESG